MRSISILARELKRSVREVWEEWAWKGRGAEGERSRMGRETGGGNEGKKGGVWEEGVDAHERGENELRSGRQRDPSGSFASRKEAKSQ